MHAASFLMRPVSAANDCERRVLPPSPPTSRPNRTFWLGRPQRAPQSAVLCALQFKDIALLTEAAR